MTIQDPNELIFRIGSSELVAVTVAKGEPFAAGFRLKKAGLEVGSGDLTNGHTFSFSATTADQSAQLDLDFQFPGPDFAGSYAVTISGSLGGDTFTQTVAGGVPFTSKTLKFLVG